jgi:Cytochrome bd-type quinol oxidase, subunit 2
MAELFGPTLLPFVFAALMGIAILVYVVLDGFDLGVGILTCLAEPEERDRMVAAIGPFWDANETWLVLAVGLLLVAFPVAHGVILTALYFPVAILLFGLILRGVAFEFRAKVSVGAKPLWDFLFFLGSVLASLSQGYMLGVYVLGLQTGWGGFLFGLLVALCLTAAYAAIGAAWLIHKTAGDLQRRAVAWLRLALVPTALGMAAISAATPLASARIMERWLGFPETLLLAPLPILSVGLFLWLWRLAARLPLEGDRHNLSPFIALSAIFLLGFLGLAWSFFPYVVPGSITIAEAASSPDSLLFILVGTLIVLPAIAGYTVFAYRVFGGKAEDLRYD